MLILFTPEERNFHRLWRENEFCYRFIENNSSIIRISFLSDFSNCLNSQTLEKWKEYHMKRKMNRYKQSVERYEVAR